MCFLAALGGFYAPEAQDVSYAERHVFTLNGSGDGLSEKADVEIRYLTSRSTDWNEFGVYEQYFATVANLRAELNGKRLGRDAIQRIQPEREDVFLASGTLHHIDLPTVPNLATYFATPTTAPTSQPPSRRSSAFPM